MRPEEMEEIARERGEENREGEEETWLVQNRLAKSAISTSPVYIIKVEIRHICQTKICNNR